MRRWVGLLSGTSFALCVSSHFSILLRCIPRCVSSGVRQRIACGSHTCMYANAPSLEMGHGDASQHEGSRSSTIRKLCFVPARPTIFLMLASPGPEHAAQRYRRKHCNWACVLIKLQHNLRLSGLGLDSFSTSRVVAQCAGSVYEVGRGGRDRTQS